jgi:hypothetical protein
MNKIKNIRDVKYRLLQLIFLFNRKKRHMALNNYREKKYLLHSNKKHYFKDVYNTPVFIISYNQLSHVKQMVDWLKKYGFMNIHIVDNRSSYKPLLNYLNKSDCVVHHMDKNYGHTVVWDSGKFDDIINKQCYIVSDCDIAPNPNMPKDFINSLYEILGQYPYITKVGFALNIKDLPKTEKNKIVKQWEKQFWQKQIDKDLYLADIDTTFALYRPGKLTMETRQFYTAMRIAGDMTAIHLPWFETEETEESSFYKKTANSSASWVKGIKQYTKKAQK